MRSLMARDVRKDDGHWYSKELGRLLGVTEVRYSAKTRSRIMGSNEEYCWNPENDQRGGCC